VIERDLGPYIETHLAYELKYLLVAATTWSAVHDEKRRAPWPDHLVVMAMESAFVHKRTLCEFLTLDEGWAKKSPHRAPALPAWDVYKGPMHMKVLHPDPRRPYAEKKRPGDDLPGQVLKLASETLGGWDGVEAQVEMDAYREAMNAARVTAIGDACRAAQRMKVRPTFA
jgi:hypothetical protein